ncbi:hypothetical protein K402DRAFT_398357 [Aulographum hederae CBS 113979]|uniref:Transglutaminase-like domain-containing protein n=1 Tax=Aulographum hederae CBS 113979 TaxID=1176131 RepID=A0A6G1GLA2_9PEZI|nr:hypothetical protein K402DRAFT_398357 [Aulographum hederae CBS 113979]
MAEGAPRQSIAERIAALQLNQVGLNPHEPDPPPTYDQAVATRRKSPPPPPLPKRTTGEFRSNSTNTPPLLTNGHPAGGKLGNEPISTLAIVPPPSLEQLGAKSKARPVPSLPPRPAARGGDSAPAPPVLPPRRDSEQSLAVRRDSIESMSSMRSGRSSLSRVSTGTSLSSPSFGDGQSGRVKAPPYDPSSLPPLPEKKAKGEREPPRVPLRPTSSSPHVTSTVTSGVKDNDRPPLPSRQNTGASNASNTSRQLPPRRSALDYAMNKSTEAAPVLPAREVPGSPPPIPISSRPDLASLQASKPRPQVADTPAAMQLSAPGDCLKCRDFSAPDAHAARFPRQSIPSQDVNWLAHQLTSPFPSATDKARAIFAWLHHNIAYDIIALLNNNIQRSTPSGTIASGLAVCEGYAGLFAALALASGLQAQVVSGHGKGAGYNPIKPGKAVPPFDSNHAWNVVRIDNGESKLIDPCWGSGSVCLRDRKYNKRLDPTWFTRDNDDFSLRHFPTDQNLWFGRPLSWEQYLTMDQLPGGPMVGYPDACAESGINMDSFQPRQLNIPLRDPNGGPTVRFAFSKYCLHWTNEKHGTGEPPWLLLLEFGDGDHRNWTVLNHDGFWWWTDVKREELGKKGGEVKISYMMEFDNRTGRGLSKEYFEHKKGRCGWRCNYAGKWNLV